MGAPDSLASESLEKYLSGDVLIGDDYGPAEIARWFEDERDAYANLAAKDATAYRYDYHALNRWHGFRHLDPERRFANACGFGSAFGDELLPVRDRLDRVTIVDSSRKFARTVLDGIDASFVEARPSGEIGAVSGAFDLITCFGVLHHIPNVSFVLRELARCLAPDGVLLLREPVSSMGDWRKPRPGCTPRERGLPAPLFRRMIEASGFVVRHHSWCVFPPLAALLARFGVSAHAYLPTVLVDHALSTLTAGNYAYHRPTLLKRFAPASEFFVCAPRAATPA
jgi:SAM-dependent methyltransferase